MGRLVTTYRAARRRGGLVSYPGLAILTSQGRREEISSEAGSRADGLLGISKNEVKQARTLGSAMFGTGVWNWADRLWTGVYMCGGWDRGIEEWSMEWLGLGKRPPD